MPCEWLFSSSKLAAVEQQSHLEAECFKQLQIMKHVWHQEVVDLAAVNSSMIEEVQEDGCGEYIEMLKLNKENTELDDLELVF